MFRRRSEFPGPIVLGVRLVPRSFACIYWVATSWFDGDFRYIIKLYHHLKASQRCFCCSPGCLIRTEIAFTSPRHHYDIHS